MGDLIERKAAVDAVREYFMNRHIKTLFDGEEEYFELEDINRVLADNKGITNAIKALPSDAPEIIRCKDCMHADKLNDTEKEYLVCNIWAGYTVPNGYCHAAGR